MRSSHMQLRLKPRLRMLRMRVSRIFSEPCQFVALESPESPIYCKLVVVVPSVSCLPDSCEYTKEVLMLLRKRGCELCLQLSQHAENSGCIDCQIQIEAGRMKEQEPPPTPPAVLIQRDTASRREKIAPFRISSNYDIQGHQSYHIK